MVYSCLIVDSFQDCHVYREHCGHQQSGDYDFGFLCINKEMETLKSYH